MPDRLPKQSLNLIHSKHGIQTFYFCQCMINFKNGIIKYLKTEPKKAKLLFFINIKIWCDRRNSEKKYYFSQIYFIILLLYIFNVRSNSIRIRSRSNRSQLININSTERITSFIKISIRNRQNISFY
jgi:hypothetical protein